MLTGFEKQLLPLHVWEILIRIILRIWLVNKLCGHYSVKELNMIWNARNVHRMVFIDKNTRVFSKLSFIAYRSFSFDDISYSLYINLRFLLKFEICFAMLIKIQRSQVNYTINLSLFEFKGSFFRSKWIMSFLVSSTCPFVQLQNPGKRLLNHHPLGSFLPKWNTKGCFRWVLSSTDKAEASWFNLFIHNGTRRIKKYSSKVKQLQKKRYSKRKQLYIYNIFYIYVYTCLWLKIDINDNYLPYS